MLLYTLLDTQPGDLWHDTVFQLVVVVIVTLLAAFIGGAFSIWIYRRQEKPKEITYQVISDAPIVDIYKPAESRVKVFLDGQEVHEPRLVVLKIKNTGRKAIVEGDYDEQVALKFAGNTVLNYEVLNIGEEKSLIDPQDQKRALKIAGDAVILPKIVLNPEASIQFSVIVDGQKNKVKAEGRIIDGEIREFDPANPPFVFRIRAYLTAFLVITVLSFIGSFSYTKGFTTDFPLQFLADFGFLSLWFIVIDLYAILKNRERIRKSGTIIQW